MNLCRRLLRAGADSASNLWLQQSDYGCRILNVSRQKHAVICIGHLRNGEELTPDHGFPVRALLPGIAGARNVKWLAILGRG